jgi:hypothetical protein
VTLRASTLARIEAGHRFSAFYRGYLANHLPMALAALDQMGADDASLERFQSRYIPSHLEPLASATVEIARGEEDMYFGKADGFPAWIAYYERRIRAEGVTDVLKAVLDRLITSVESGAFHGAIRCAYALESQNPREMAHALAYWSAALEISAPLVTPRGAQTATQVFSEVHADPALSGKRAPGRNIVSRIRSVMGKPAWREHAERLGPRHLSVDHLAQALIRAYAATGDFTLLHGVTACHAMRVLIRFAADRDAAVTRLWSALLAAYMGEGSPRPDGWALEGSDMLDWPEIHRRAVLCDDEHDIKLAFSCWREWQAYGDDLYRRVASAQVCHATSAVEAC